MKKKNQILNITAKVLSEDEIKKIDAEKYYAVDAWNEKTARECLFSQYKDPWEYLCELRLGLKGTKLRVTLRGQALLGERHYSDELVQTFIAVLADCGIDIVRVYDALNDARNLEASLKAVKKYGMQAEAAIMYAEGPVYSAPFFAGYAAQLAAMGADSVAICGIPSEQTANELVKAIKGAIEIPVTVSATADTVCESALDAGASLCELCDEKKYYSEFGIEIEAIRAEIGYAPLAQPVSGIIYGQAINNLSPLSHERYSDITQEFRHLVCGNYGKTPAPIDREFSEKIRGGDPLVLVRPADLIEPEYEKFRAELSPYFEDAEDVLTYAVFGRETMEFFKHRNAKKYSLDLLHSDASRGIHTV